MIHMTNKINIIKACRCSFLVEIDGQIAYISNQNLLTLMDDPFTEYTIVPHDFRGKTQNWVYVCEKRWINGLKKRMFNCC